MNLFVLAAVVTSLAEGSVRIYGRAELAHACPVSETEALTAEHVSSVEVHGDPRQHVVVPLLAVSENGVAIVREVDADATRDFSRLQIVKGDKFVKWFKVADRAPAAGDRVYVSGYNFAKGAIPGVGSGKILKVDGPQITYDRNFDYGSSGSCVLNDRGEVVAINVGFFRIEGLNDKYAVGIGVAVYGRWQEMLVSEKVGE